MKNIMTRAWEIYRTLTNGTHLEKLSAALRTAWAEFKNAVKSVKDQVIDRLNAIVAASATHNYCELTIVLHDWANYGKDRTYVKIVERSTIRTSKHYVERDYGYIDNASNTYVAGKHNAFDNYTFSGARF